MKKLTHISSVIVLILLALGCEPKPQAIAYGEEACAYCRMSIVDRRYAAQLVSAKGKVYSFDAVECMIHFKQENRDQQWYLELLTDYSQPGELIPAAEATILRSRQLPSPMGMYLTAVGSEEQAQALLGENDGKLYRYEEVAENLDKLPAL